MNSEIVSSENRVERLTSAPHRPASVLMLDRGFVIASVFFISLFVALRLSGIPWKFAVSSFASRYGAVAVQSIAYASVLALIGMTREVLTPLKNRYTNSPVRLIIIGLLAILFFYLYPAFAASVFLIIAVAVLEVYERGITLRELAKPVLPALYLFIGLVTVFGYNAVIVTTRSANYSHVLVKIDSYLLFGHSVPELAHRFCAAAPQSVTDVLMVCYFALFAQIGAALLITSYKGGQKEGMKFVSTILLGYLITMVIFALFPSYSPYFSCKDHASSHLPPLVLEAHHSLMAQASLRHHHGFALIDTEYYVAFPCMHLAQPLIVLWFLRRWRRILAVLILVDTVLTFAIVLLEWHYVTDLLGGIVVAAIAIGTIRYLSHAADPRTRTRALAAPAE